MAETDQAPQQQAASPEQVYANFQFGASPSHRAKNRLLEPITIAPSRPESPPKTRGLARDWHELARGASVEKGRRIGC
jgi:hypothetical protein